MNKIIKLTIYVILAISFSSCTHFEKKAPCDFHGYQSDNQSKKEDKTQ
ncbi:MAG: hypothetical protein QM478_11675 [Flavobacteriaceae bacterium]